MRVMRVSALVVLLTLPALVFSIDLQTKGGAKLEITSRTSFGIDLQDGKNFGLLNEFTRFNLILGLLPFQWVSNRPNTSDAVGFIGLTLQDLNIVRYKGDSQPGFNDPMPAYTTRYQPGNLLAGISIGSWLVQLNAGGNEPFAAPWFKGMEYINDGFKMSWAYLDSMVDIRRVKTITGIPVITWRGEEHLLRPNEGDDDGTVRNFSFQVLGNIADRFGADISSSGMIGAMYNHDSFGLSFKLGTRYPFEPDWDRSNSRRENDNGLALAFDSVFMPWFLPGLKVFASLLGTINYHETAAGVKQPEPVMGGTRIGYIIPLSNVISVEPWLGLDLGTKIIPENMGTGAEKPEYEFSIGATMRWPGESGWVVDYITNSEGRVYPGLSLAYKIYENLERQTGMEHSVRFTLFEPRGNTQGIFYNVGSEMVIDIIDITDAFSGKPWGTSGGGILDNPAIQGFKVLGTLYFDYSFSEIKKLPGILRPWTILFYDNFPGATSDAKRINDFKIDLGLSLEGAITNTTFGIVWNSGSIIQNKDPGFLRLLVEIRL